MRSQCPVYVIDLTGAAVLSALLGGCVWLILVRGDHARSDVRDLRTSLAAAQKDLAALDSTRDQQKAALASRQRELAERGHLPEHTPVEAYFQSLAALAAQNRLSVLRHQPLAPRTYPGLLERRYAYEVAGGFEGLIEFLTAIEHSEFWADVSYLRIQTAQRAEKDSAAQRLALLTMSVFSAAPAGDEHGG